jgi:hypothetical protein
MKCSVREPRSEGFHDVPRWYLQQGLAEGHWPYILTINRLPVDGTRYEESRQSRIFGGTRAFPYVVFTM